MPKHIRAQRKHIQELSNGGHYPCLRLVIISWPLDCGNQGVCLHSHSEGLDRGVFCCTWKMRKCSRSEGYCLKQYQGMHPYADLSPVMRAEVNGRFELTKLHRDFIWCDWENTGFREGWSRG